VNNKIDSLLSNIINSEEQPSGNLSDRTRNLFSNLNIDSLETQGRMSIFLKHRRLISLVSTAAVILLCIGTYISLPRFSTPPMSGKADIASAKSTPVIADSDAKNQKQKISNLNPDVIDGYARISFTGHLSIEKAKNNLFNPAESVIFKLSAKASFSKIKIVSDPIIKIFKCGTAAGIENGDSHHPLAKSVSQFPIEGLANTTLESNQSRDVYKTVSLPSEPDWYYAFIQVRVCEESGHIYDTGFYSKEFMIEYPENETYTKDLKIGKVINVDGYPVTIESISMDDAKTYVKFSTDSKITNCRIYILTDSGGSITPLDLARDGESVYGPVPKDVHKLIFEIRSVFEVLSGTKEQGDFKS